MTTTVAPPTSYEPALCQTTTGQRPRPQEWWMEPKMDGIRLQIVARGGQVHCFARSGLRYDGRLPAAEDALSALDVVVGGEVVWFSPESGEIDFHRGSGIFRRGDSAVAQRFEGPLTFVAFDLLEVAGQDIRRQPIETRRALLAQLVEGLGCPQIRLIEQAEVSPEAREQFIATYREGVVLKKKGSTYRAGRSPEWLKMKVVEDADVVIMGFERGNGKYANTLGCIVFGQYRGEQLVERGTCSGMTDAERDEMWRFPERYIDKVLVIRHMGTDGDGFRHPQFDHVRDLEDKQPEECVWS